MLREDVGGKNTKYAKNLSSSSKKANLYQSIDKQRVVIYKVAYY